MKYCLVILLLLAFSLVGQGQSGAWTVLTDPNSDRLGQLVKKKGFEGQGITDTTKIETSRGVTSLQDSNFSSWSVKLTSAIQFKHFRATKATYKHIVVDAIKDISVFENDEYYGNFFVIRAKRADTVELTIERSDSLTVDPSSLLSDSLVKAAISKVVPWLAEIKFAYASGKKLTYEIVDPRVYFEAEIVKFKSKRPFYTVHFADDDGRSSHSDTLYQGDHKTAIIPFKDNFYVRILTLDTVVTSGGKKDTTFSLGLDVSQTLRQDCIFQPMPYRIPRSPNNLRVETYEMLDNLLLVSSSDDSYLYCYINVFAKKTPQGIVYNGQSLSDGVLLNYIILQFQRYGKTRL